MRDRRFVSGGILEYWGVLIVGPERFAPQMKVENFISGLLDMGRRTGLNVVHREPAYMRCERGGDDIASSLRALNDRVQQMFNGAMRFCICVVGGDTDTYARIKLITDVQMGLPSQCVRAVKIMV